MSAKKILEKMQSKATAAATDEVLPQPVAAEPAEQPSFASQAFNAPGMLKNKALAAIAQKLGNKEASEDSPDLAFDVVDSLAKKAGLPDNDDAVQNIKAAAATAINTFAPETVLDVLPVGKIAKGAKVLAANAPTAFKAAAKVVDEAAPHVQQADASKLMEAVRRAARDRTMAALKYKPANLAQQMVDAGAKPVAYTNIVKGMK